MNEYIQRMLDEGIQLQNRVDKLEKFIRLNPIYQGLGEEKRELMKKQLLHMRGYLNVLTQRIQLEDK